MPSPPRLRSHLANTAASVLSPSVCAKSPADASLLTLPAALERMSLSALRAQIAAEPVFVISAPSRMSLTFASSGALTTIWPSESVPLRR